MDVHDNEFQNEDAMMDLPAPATAISHNTCLMAVFSQVKRSPRFWLWSSPNSQVRVAGKRRRYISKISFSTLFCSSSSIWNQRANCFNNSTSVVTAVLVCVVPLRFSVGGVVSLAIPHLQTWIHWQDQCKSRHPGWNWCRCWKAHCPAEWRASAFGIWQLAEVSYSLQRHTMTTLDAQTPAAIALKMSPSTLFSSNQYVKHCSSEHLMILITAASSSIYYYGYTLFSTRCTTTC